jgi:hypothetical protein
MNSKRVIRRIKEFHEDMLGKEKGALSFYYTYHSLEYEAYSKSGEPFEKILKSIFSKITLPKEKIEGKYGDFFIDRFNKRIVYLYKDLAIEDNYSDPSEIDGIKSKDEYQEWLMISKILSYPPAGKISIIKSKPDLILQELRSYFMKMHGNEGKKIYYSLYHYAEAESIKDYAKGLREVLNDYIVDDIELKGTQVPGKLGNFYINEDEEEIIYTYDRMKLSVKYEIDPKDFKKIEEYVLSHRELMPNAHGDTEDWLINVFRAPFAKGAKIKISVS